jgi:hypothetical protein
MAIHRRLRRLILLGASAVTIGTAPPAIAEPTGDNMDYAPYGNGVPTVISGGPVPTLNGVPCVAGHLGTCISIAANQPSPRTPLTRVGHSPTITR